jgi:hypothetical protein
MSRKKCRINGRLRQRTTSARYNAFWQCPYCQMRVKGTKREIERTQAVHSCGLEERR